MSKILVISHSDPDGDMSAAIVHHFENNRFNEIEHHKINYGQPIPWSKIKKADKVIVCDFSFQPFKYMVKALKMKGDNLIVIDHHKTAIEDIEKSGLKFKGIQRYSLDPDINRAGCELTYEYYSDKKIPLSIRLTGRYDIWDKRYQLETFPFIYGLCERDMYPTSDIMQRLVNNDIELTNQILNDGKIIQSYNIKKFEKLCQQYSFDIELLGYKLLACNVMGVNSTFFDSMINYDKYDGMMSFCMRSNKEWTVSVYTEKPNTDVSIIARHFNGGGHTQACGFQCDNDTFNKIING